jgi:NADPH oxidase 5
VYIDGPFGAPTSQIFRAQHAVLIGTGIGVTPFASILQSIMHRYWQARNTCPKCHYMWTNDLTTSVINLRKARKLLFYFWGANKSV